MTGGIQKQQAAPPVAPASSTPPPAPAGRHLHTRRPDEATTQNPTSRQATGGNRPGDVTMLGRAGRLGSAPGLAARTCGEAEGAVLQEVLHTAGVEVVCRALSRINPGDETHRHGECRRCKACQPAVPASSARASAYRARLSAGNGPQHAAAWPFRMKQGCSPSGWRCRTGACRATRAASHSRSTSMPTTASEAGPAAAGHSPAPAQLALLLPQVPPRPQLLPPLPWGLRPRLR